MFKRYGVWQYDFIIGGKRYRGSTGHTDTAKAKAQEEKLKVQYREGYSAEVIWEQTKRQLLAGKELNIDPDEIWKAFESQATSRANPQRQKVYFSRLVEFCNWLKQNHPGTKRISEVSTTQAKEWVAYIRSLEGSNSTKNDKLIALKMIFSSLGKEYGIIEDPFAAIKKLPTKTIARAAFTPEELKLIGQNATGWMYSLCVTAISTGLREGDVCLLKKSSVNLYNGWISIPHTRKTGVDVEIPILPGLAKHLNEVLSEDNETEFVFPVLAEKYTSDPCCISKAIKAFFEQIGINNTTKKVDGYARKISSKDAHSFRHTFIYLAALNNIPLPIVQGIVGHVSPEMTKHYMDHAGREAKTQYLSQLPEYFTPSREKEKTPREKLAELAYSLPIDEVQRILASISPGLTEML